uniref:aprataxin and PNK-like factor isoform X2 n=1 Tax=Pristiophorus japonicus TaxID=55135 RepID=UPI00398F0429
MLELELVDGKGTIALAAGLTTIGRGPVLGVSDKRVSRIHGLLEVLDEKLRIKPLHTNPCFHQSSSGDQLLPLEKDKWHWLNSGDCFSLLPDKYIYKVISSSHDQTLRNSDLSSIEDVTDDQSNSPENLHMGKEEVNEGPNISPSCTQTATTSSRTVTTDDHSREQSSAFEPNSNLDNVSEQLKNGHAPVNPVQRKRVLPAWMLQGTTEIPSSSSIINKKGNVRGQGRGRSDAEHTKTPVTQPGRKRHESFENLEDNETTDQPQEKKGRSKKMKLIEGETQSKNNTKENTLGANATNVKRKEEIKNKLNMPSKIKENWRLDDNGEGKSQHDHGSQQTREISIWEMSDKEEEEEVGPMSRPGEQENVQQSETSLTHRQGPLAKSSSPEPDEPEGASAFQTKEEKKLQRAPCVYGNNCYRKNPLHFQELSHPGDADYEYSTGGEEDDDKPECPFGTACYRRNPQHKKEYKHTQPPGKSGLDDESNDDGEPNQYNLNDSFINDEDEDLDPTDEDSDWEPSSDSNEDIDTLTKEASRFVKNKK